MCSGSLETAETAYLETALRRNLTLRADSLDWVSGRETQIGAEAAFQPKFGITGTVLTQRPTDGGSDEQMQLGLTASQWIQGGGTSTVGWNGAISRSDPVRPPAFVDGDTSTLSLSFRQPLLRGFGEAAPELYALRQAKATRTQRFLAAQGQGLALLQQCRTAFWNVVAIRAQVRALADDSVRQAKLLEATRIQFVTGALAELDTLTANQTYFKARLSLLQARQQEREGLRQLSVLADTTGLSFPQPDTLPQMAFATYPDAGILLEQAVKRAPDIAQAQARIQAQESEVVYRKSGVLPQLDGSIYGRSGLPGANPAKDWTVGVRLDLDWSLPSGAERAKYRQALSDLGALKVRDNAARQELRHQIERILEAYASNQEQLVVAFELVRVEKARLRSVEASQKAGARSLSDLDAARTDWLSAVQAAWQAFAGAKSLEAELETRTGIGPARRGWFWEEK